MKKENITNNMKMKKQLKPIGQKIEMEIEEYTKFFKKLGKLIDTIGLLGVVSSLLFFCAIFFDFSQYIGKYSQITYFDISLSFSSSLFIAFLGNKIKKRDFFSDRYLIVAFLIIFPLPIFGPFGLLGLILWIVFVFLSIQGFIKIYRLKKSGGYSLVFSENIPVKINYQKEQLSKKEESLYVKNRYSNFKKDSLFSNNHLGLDKVVKTVFIVGFLLISFSIVYSFFLKDFIQKLEESRCFKNADKNLEISKHNINIEKEGLIKERDVLNVKRPEILRELDVLSQEIENNKFKKDDTQMRIVKERTEEDYKEQQEFNSGGSWARLNSYFNRSKDEIYKSVYNNLKNQFIKEDPDFKLKDEESQKNGDRIRDIENKLRSLDNDILIAENKHSQDKDFCLKRY